MNLVTFSYISYTYELHTVQCFICYEFSHFFFRKCLFIEAQRSKDQIITLKITHQSLFLPNYTILNKIVIQIRHIRKILSNYIFCIKT